MASPWGMPASYSRQAYNGWPSYGWPSSQPSQMTNNTAPSQGKTVPDKPKDPPPPDPTDSLKTLYQDADDPSKWPNFGLRPGVDFASWRECRDVVYGRIGRTMQYLHDLNPNWTQTMFGDEPGLTFKEHRTDPHSHTFPHNPLAYSDAEMTWHGVDMLTPQDVDDALKDEMLSASDPRKKGYIENALGMNADVYAPLRGARRSRKV